MSDEWFHSKIAPDDEVEDGCHPDEAQALKDYLRNRTTASAAAHAITRPVENSDNPVNHLYRLWGLLQDALVELPEIQTPALIALLEAIQKLPEPDRELGGVSIEGTLWHDMSQWGSNWADGHQYDGWFEHWIDSEPESRDKLRARYVREKEIEARICLSGVGWRCSPLDWGYDYIAQALEREKAVLDFEIPGAEQWISFAGERIYAGALSGQESWALERKRDFGMEAKAMSLERWLFWETRLDRIQESQATPESAKEAARRMIVSMQKIRRKGRNEVA